MIGQQESYTDDSLPDEDDEYLEPPRPNPGDPKYNVPKLCAYLRSQAHRADEVTPDELTDFVVGYW